MDVGVGNISLVSLVEKKINFGNVKVVTKTEERIRYLRIYCTSHVKRKILKIFQNKLLTRTLMSYSFSNLHSLEEDILHSLENFE